MAQLLYPSREFPEEVKALVREKRWESLLNIDEKYPELFYANILVHKNIVDCPLHILQVFIDKCRCIDNLLYIACWGKKTYLLKSVMVHPRFVNSPSYKENIYKALLEAIKKDYVEGIAIFYQASADKYNDRWKNVTAFQMALSGIKSRPYILKVLAIQALVSITVVPRIGLMSAANGVSMDIFRRLQEYIS
jgi:hypothetical protein